MARLASLLRNQRLTLLGAAFVVAGNAVAYGDTGYPFLGPGFAALLGVSAIAALVLALPLAFRPAARAAAFAIGFTYFLDVAYIGGGWVAAVALMGLAGYLTYLVGWRRNGTVVTFATTAVAVSVVFILPQQALFPSRFAPSSFALSEGRADAGRPYVHIILDEMSPLDMMPKGPFYDGLKRRMAEDYRRRGFDLFQDTVAPAGETIVSLGEVFADDDGEMHNYAETEGTFTYAMGENRAVAKLSEAGYAITMLQNDYLQICKPEHGNCLTYGRTGNGAALAERADGALTATGYALRATGLRLLISNSVRAAAYVQELGALAGWLGFDLPEWDRDFARPPLTLALMEEAAPALGRLQGGEAVFMHFLLPHYPYLLDADCRVKPAGRVRAPLWVARHIALEFEAAATERAYWEQAACTHDRLMAIVDAILASPGGKDAVILVHGDHGSRLSTRVIDETTSESVRRHTLLAHFAVRGLTGRHDRLAAETGLRQRVSVVLDAALDAPEPEPGLMTSAMQ
jgi:hypothetical protein